MVPLSKCEVTDQSTEVNTSPGNSQTPKLKPVTVELLNRMNVSPTTYPKLMVQASSLPLIGPSSYSTCAEVGKTIAKMQSNAGSKDRVGIRVPSTGEHYPTVASAIL